MCYYMRYVSRCARCNKNLETEDMVSKPCNRSECTRTLKDIEARVYSHLDNCGPCEKALAAQQ